MLKRAEFEVQSALELIATANRKVARISQHSRVEINQILELSDKQRAVYETLKRLQLRLKLIRNIKMNWPLWQKRNKSIEVRLNQLQGLEQFIRFLEDENYEFATDQSALLEVKNLNPLVGHYVQPTGAGKTGLFAIETALADVKTLALVPFDNLMYQTADDFELIGAIDKHRIGILSSGSPKDLQERQILISTYAGHLARMRKDENYRNMIQEECELVWCDEGHMALGERTQEVISAIDELALEEMTEDEQNAEREILEGNGQFIPAKSVKVAFTATPKLSSKHVREKFGRCIGRIYQSELVQAGINVRYEVIHTDGKIEDGDQIMDRMTEGEEVKILNREGIYEKLLTEYAMALKTYHQLRIKNPNTEMPVYGMAFCTNHQECEKLKKDAKKLGLNFEILTGEELSGGEKGRDQLRMAEERLLNHEIDGFVTVEKLATGYSPNFMNTILWARVTSSAKTVQGIGRGGRRHTYPEGIQKTHCTVIETNWTLSRKAKRGKKTPLRLADALYEQGEDPEAICGMANGGKLEVRKTLTAERAGELIKKDYTPTDWIKMERPAKKLFKLEGAGLKALATLFGSGGNPVNNKEEMKKLGMAIWKEEWTDPAAKERERILNRIKSEYTPEKWMGISRTAMKTIKIENMGLRALGSFLGLNFVENTFEQHRMIGEAIWGKHAAFETNADLQERICNTLKNQFTPKSWMKMSKEEKQKYKFEGMGLTALAGMFGIDGVPSQHKESFTSLGKAIFKQDWVDPDADRKDRILEFIRSAYDQKSWNAMTTAQKKDFEFDGLGLRGIAGALGLPLSPLAKREDHISLGNAIWNNSK